MKKIFIMNGSGGTGKDTFVRFVSEHCQTYHVSSVTEIKHIAKIMGWQGGKTEIDRKFLSDLKDLATSYNDFPLVTIVKKIQYFNDSFSDNSIMFIDIREPNEISKVKKHCENFNNIKIGTVLISNENTPKIKSNHADASVYDYNYDYYIDNNGTLEELKETAKTFFDFLINSTKDDENEKI